jgi:hypothetical protein
MIEQHHVVEGEIFLNPVHVLPRYRIVEDELRPPERKAALASASRSGRSLVVTIWI